ncbi:MAG: hypothetical protein DRP01_01960 [Archaeoglobales archaeon]|nr:MAG: hypothetical protein DRP01_01960 [Archaeoglobales archaeon]
MSEHEVALELSPEEIARVAKLLADSLAKEPELIAEVAFSAQLEVSEEGVTFGASCAAVFSESEFVQYVRLDLIASAVHGVTDPLGQLRGFLTSLIDGAKNWIVSQLRGVIEGVKDFISDILAQVLIKVGEVAPHVIREVGSAISDAIREITSATRDYFNTLNAGITSLGSSLSNAISSVGSSLSSAISSTASALSSAISTVGSTLSSTISSVASTLSSAISSVASTISSAISSATSTLSSAISSVGSSLSSAISSLGSSLSSAISSVGASLSRSIASVAASISASITALGTSLSGAIAAMGSSLGAAIASVGASLATAINQVGASLSVAIVNVSTALSGAIAQLGYSLSSSIAALGASLSTAIAQVGASIGTAIATASASLATGIAQVGAAVAQATVTIVSAISTSIVELGAALSTAITQLSSSIAVGFATVGAGIAQAANMILGTLAARITDLGASLAAAIGSVGASLAGTIALLRGDIQTAVRIWQEYVPAMYDSLSSGIRELHSTIVEGMELISQTIDRSLTDFAQTVADNMRTIIGAIVDTAKATADMIRDIMTEFTDAVARNLETITSAILESYNRLMDSIIENMDRFTGKVLDTYNRLQEALNRHFRDVINNLTWSSKELTDRILENAREVQKFIIQSYKDLMEALREELEKFGKALTELGKVLMGFTNAILQLPELFEGHMTSYARKWTKAYWDVTLGAASPPPALVYFSYYWASVKEGFSEDAYKGMKMFWENLTKLYEAESPAWWDVFVWMFTDPWKFVETVFIKPLQDAWKKFLDFLEWVRKGLVSFWETIQKAFWEGVRGITEALKGLVVAAFKGIESLTADLGMAYINLFRGHSPGPLDGLVDWVKGLFDAIVEPTKKAFEDAFKPFWEGDIWGALKMAELTGIEFGEFATKMTENIIYTIGALLFPFYGQLPIRVVTWTGKAVARWLGGLELPLRINLRPVGIGVDTTINLAKSLGASLHTFCDWLERSMRRLQDSITYGLGIWITRPIARLLNTLFRNLVTVNIPREDTLLEVLRRWMEYESERGLPTTNFQFLWAKIRYYLATFGYSDEAIYTMIAPANEEYVEIKDRFYEYTRRARRWPRSLMHELPPPSDVCRMMVRDIILEPESFVKALQMRGMTRDIAIMYYLLHFRYPPPERLWHFFTRGISYMLWAKASDEDRADAAKLGLPPPSDATALQGKAAELTELFKSYMKWHDYARFAWKEGWPSDNVIIQDVLADIPTKIDQRWMVRWGIYELMGAKGVGISTPMSTVASSVIEGQPASGIRLDLTVFCRTLQATGLHPYWVPVTAVAEAVNALTEERTLLRTGFINLFREGFWDIDSLEKFLSGFITASFKVAYFDAEHLSWKSGWINLPIMFLPPERKLLELRALMDRALDILRDIQKDVLTGYQEFIIESYDEVKERLNSVVSSINAYFSAAYKDITGTTLPEELRLKVVESYFKPYVDALSIWRDVFTVRRIRRWTQRWLGWIMYRVAYGAVTTEDLAKLIELVDKYAKLTDLEIKFIGEVAEVLFGIAMREYAPTPSQLATLAEYVNVTDEDINRAFEARQIPAEWQDLWRKYIKARPFADDVRGLLTSLRRAMLYAPVPEELKSTALECAKLINFTEKELQILWKRVELETLVREYSANIPTPMTLATIAEVVKVPDSLINQMFAVRKTPAAWRALYSDYIRVKPLADDIRGLINAYFRALRYTNAAKGYEGQVLAAAKMLNFTEDELKIFDLRSQIEMLRAEASQNRREYIPTPMSLATIAEYIPEARKFFQQVMEAKMVPEEWRPLWAKYVDLRPLVNEVRRMLTRAEALYARFMMKKEDFERILTNYAEQFGLTDKEKDLMMYTGDLERWRNAWTELIGTVSRLMTLAEYSPKARDYALGKVYEMVEALPLTPQEKQELKEMYEQYIRVRPVMSEVRQYIRDLINLYVDGLIDDATLSSELEALKKWGLDDYEIQFYKAIAGLRKARKLRIPLSYTPEEGEGAG